MTVCNEIREGDLRRLERCHVERDEAGHEGRAPEEGVAVLRRRVEREDLETGRPAFGVAGLAARRQRVGGEPPEAADPVARGEEEQQRQEEALDGRVEAEERVGGERIRGGGGAQQGDEDAQIDEGTSDEPRTRLRSM